MVLSCRCLVVTQKPSCKVPRCPPCHFCTSKACQPQSNTRAKICKNDLANDSLSKKVPLLEQAEISEYLCKVFLYVFQAFLENVRMHRTKRTAPHRASVGYSIHNEDAFSHNRTLLHKHTPFGALVAHVRYPAVTREKEPEGCVIRAATERESWASNVSHLFGGAVH